MIESVRTWRLLRDLRAGPRAPRQELERMQEDLLRRAVAHAYKEIPFYRRIWDEWGVDPGQIRGLSDLGLLPTIGGPVVRDAIESGELRSRGTRPAPGPFRTSGASGRQLTVPRGPAEQRLWRAVALRAFFEHGYSWRQSTIAFEDQPSPSHPLQRFGISRTAWISPGLPAEEQLAALREAEADVVVGTPTVLRRIARGAEVAAKRIPRPRVLFWQGEVLDGGTGALIERIFGSAPVGLYGLTEVGYLGWQCERRAGFHLNAETCLVELLRGGRPAGPGELGSVVVTDLRGRTMPMIRYDTGDLAIAAAGPCPCGRSLPVIDSVEGRARDAITVDGGRVLTTRRIVDACGDLMLPDRYRLEQQAPAGFRLSIDPGASHQADAMARRLAELLGEVEIQVVPGLPAGTADGTKTATVTSAVKFKASLPGTRAPRAGTSAPSGP